MLMLISVLKGVRHQTHIRRGHNANATIFKSMPTEVTPMISYFAGNSNMVKVILLCISSCMDNLWACNFPSQWQIRSCWDTGRSLSNFSEGLPWDTTRVQLWFPSSCCCSPCWVGTCLLFCLCLWNQVPELPKEMEKNIFLFVFINIS